MRSRVRAGVVGAFGFVGLGLLLGAAPATAQTYLRTAVDAYLHPDFVPGQLEREIVFFREVVFDTGYLTYVESRTIDAPDGHTIDMDAEVFAHSAFNENKAWVDLSVVDGYRASASVTAYSEWEDEFRIVCLDPPVCEGQSDAVQLGIGVSGTYSGNPFSHLDPDPEFYVEYSVRVGPADGFLGPLLDVYNEKSEQHGWAEIVDRNGDRYYFPIAQVPGVYLTWLHFEYGEPLRLESLLAAEVGAINYDGTFSGVATVDFSATAKITSIDLPPHAALVSESGAIWPIPEAATAGAGVAAAAALGVVVRRRDALLRPRRRSAACGGSGSADV